MIENDLLFKPRLQVVNESQILKIHEATAKVLEHTGVKITHAAALEIFAGGGAKVVKDRVYIPREMLEDAIQKAPSRIVLGNRRGEQAIVLEKETCQFGATLDDIYYFDPDTRKRRLLTSDDCRKIVSLLDALPNLTWGMTFGAISDVPAHLADRYAAKQALTYSQKPMVFTSNNMNSLRDIHAMARVITPDERSFKNTPPMVSFVTSISPLVIADHVIEQMMFAAERNIPQVCYAGIQAGSTAPMTFAGVVVQGNAETLACLVFNQLVRSGSPVIYGSFASIMDMRTSVFSFAAPEMDLMVAAQCQVARHYGIPFYGTAGCSDSKLPDAQASAEAVFSCFASALSGANLVHDAGLLEYGTMISPEHIVLVNEVLNMVGQFMRGLPVDADSLALDVIDAVGPGGHYLEAEHTMRHFRDVWYSTLFDRQTHDGWMEQGAKDMGERLREQTLALMRHEPEPLPEEVLKELDAMSLHWV